MRALVYRRYGGPEELRLTELAPPRPGPGQVVVRMEASSVNAADLRLLRANPFLVRLVNGLWRPVKRRVPGQDVAGVVAAVGVGVSRFTPGDRVFGETRMHADGAFADLCLADAAALAPLPAGLGFPQAAALPLAGTTAVQALRATRVERGGRVLLVGAGGGVGSFLVQVARLRGLHVTATCGPRSVELVRRLGAHEVVDHSRTALSSLPSGFDAVVAVNGYHPLWTYARLLRWGGRYVLVGGANGQLFQALLLARPALALVGRHGQVLTIDPRHQAADVAQLGQWAEGGELQVPIEATYPLARAAEALARAEQGHVAGKLVIVP